MPRYVKVMHEGAISEEDEHHEQQQAPRLRNDHPDISSTASTFAMHSHWVDLYGGSKIRQEFQEFRLHDGSNYVYLLLMALFIVMISSSLLPIVTRFPHTFLSHALFVFYTISIIVVLFLTTIKVAAMIASSIEEKNDRIGKQKDVRQRGLFGWRNINAGQQIETEQIHNELQNNTHARDSSNTGINSNRSNYQEFDSLQKYLRHVVPTSKASAIHHVSMFNAFLETLCSALVTFGMVLYVAFMVVLRHNYDYDKEDVPTIRALPEGLAGASLMMPVLLYMVFKQLRFRYAIYIMLGAFAGNMIVLVLYDLRVSLPRALMGVILSLFILFEYHRQCWHSFMISNQLVKTLDENSRLADEVKSTELRHMIGNVAHDLKTPLSSFISGMEVIRLVAKELQGDMKEAHGKSQCSTVVMQEKLSTILEVAENVTNTNTFMIMTINRCIDYNKTLFGLKLLPKKETFLLRDSIDFTIVCLQGMHTKDMLLIDCTYNSVELRKGEIMIKTDKHWLQENLLCLIGNAAKFTPHGKKIRVEFSVVRKAEPLIAHEDQAGSLSTIAGDELFSAAGSTTSLTVVPFNKSSTGSVVHGDRSAIYDIEEGISSNTAVLTTIGHDSAVVMRENAKDTKSKGSSALPINVGQSSTISSNTTSNDSFLKIEVIDGGPGVDDQFRSKLFEEPAQAARLNGGTGLGLYSLARRVETLGGEYGITNRPDGEQGSLFWFTIPFHQQFLSCSHISAASSSLNVTACTAPICTLPMPNAPWKGALYEVPSIRGQGLRQDSTQYLARDSSKALLGNLSPASLGSGNFLAGTSERNRNRSDSQHQVRRFSASSYLSDEHSLSIGHRSRHFQSRSKSKAESSEEGSLSQAAAATAAVPSPGPNSTVTDDTLPPPRVELPKQLTVLVVDDSLPILKMTSLALRKQGHHVITAENGAEAVATFKQHLTSADSEDTLTTITSESSLLQQPPRLLPFDVVLMDFQMPIMDGLEAIAKVRDFEQEHFVKSITAASTTHSTTTFSSASHQEVVIIGFSAKSDEYQIEEGYSKGMDAFLPKPFTIAAFQNILQSFLQQQQQQYGTGLRTRLEVGGASS